MHRRFLRSTWRCSFVILLTRNVWTRRSTLDVSRGSHSNHVGNRTCSFLRNSFSSILFTVCTYTFTQELSIIKRILSQLLALPPTFMTFCDSCVLPWIRENLTFPLFLGVIGSHTRSKNVNFFLYYCLFRPYYEIDFWSQWNLYFRCLVTSWLIIYCISLWVIAGYSMENIVGI